MVTTSSKSEKLISENENKTRSTLIDFEKTNKFKIIHNEVEKKYFTKSN